MMKKFVVFAILAILLASCGNNSGEKTNSDNASNDSISEQKLPEILPVTDSVFQSPYYIINIAATSDIDSAVDLVKTMRNDFESVNYLWIPDFESLSGKDMYSVFLGPYKSIETVVPALMDYNEDFSKTYAVIVSHDSERRAIYSPFDIRVDNKKVKQIFIYSRPEDEDEYYEGGGEDWGWFVSEVQQYFSDNHPEIEFFSVYNSMLRDKDIKSLEKELELDGSFGYILNDGKNKTFLQHSPSSQIISETCLFFGLVMNEVD